MSIKINPLGANRTELELSNGVSVLFSYKTPVAAYVPGKGRLKSATFYSQTTSKHINAWGGREALVVPQADIDALVNNC